jgi:hypothetical protein
MGHSVRWAAVWGALGLWFVALMFNWGGNAVHLLLVAAVVLLVYELLIEEPPPAA